MGVRACEEGGRGWHDAFTTRVMPEIVGCRVEVGGEWSWEVSAELPGATLLTL